MKEERNFDNLEEFLQSEADSQKMYPSDTVWSNISKQIQPKRSWPALTIISLFILGSLGTATFLNYPPENPFSKFHFTNTAIQVNANTTGTASNNQTFKTSLQQHLLASISKKRAIVSSEYSKHNKPLLSINQISYLAEIKGNKQESGVSLSTTTENNKSFEKGVLATVGNISTLRQPSFISKILKQNNNNKEKILIILMM